jgi:hypothetical protein
MQLNTLQKINRRVKSTFLIIANIILFGVIPVMPLLVAEDGPVLTKTEQTTLRAIAIEWIKLGEWCVEKKLGAQARLCVNRAETADSAMSGLKELKEKSDTCEDTAIESDLKMWETAVNKISHKTAESYDKLFAERECEKDPKIKERFDKYLWFAIEISPTDTRWATVISIIENIVKAKDFERAVLLADRSLALNPPEKLVPALKNVLDNAAINSFVVKTASTHPIKYYFSLPKDFKRTKDKKWPVLMAWPGSASDFRWIAGGYTNNRGTLPYILVVPFTFSNDGGTFVVHRQYYSDEIIKEGKKQNINWDERGIFAIINDLQVNYDAESRVYITGFSRGGNLTYWMIFKHPNLLNGAAPACPLFSSSIASANKEKLSADDLDFPIHIITGEKDTLRQKLEPCCDEAEIFLKKFQYPNYKRTMIPGLKHMPAFEQVIETFKPYWEGKKKRSDKLE